MNHSLRRLTHDDYTVACICPMGVELAPVCAMLDERHQSLPTNRDMNCYILGCMGAHNIVIAVMPETGNNIAATVATQLLNDFRSIRFSLLVGIGGGIPGDDEGDIRLGDVVISKPTETFGGVVQFDKGKTHSNGQFERTGILKKPPAVLMANVENLRAQHKMLGNQISKYLSEMFEKFPNMEEEYVCPGVDEDQLFEASYNHEGGKTCGQCDRRKVVKRAPRKNATPKVHYGTIGSANGVIRDGKTRDKLRKDLGIVCVEMEAAGLMDEISCLVIRGICDYADSHKNKRWQPYAAAAAAAYAKELLSIIPAQEIVRTTKTVDAFQISKGLERRRILHWLSPSAIEDDLARLSKAFTSGSCDWLQQIPEFTSFFDSNCSRVACIHAVSGWGKSTIAAATVQHASQMGHDVLYFFHNANNFEKNSLVVFSRTVLWQLVQKDDSLMEFIRPMFWSSNRPEADSQTEIWPVLVQALTNTKLSPIVLVIDAVNESLDPEGLCGLIDELSMIKNPRLLILCTDRETRLPPLFSMTSKISELRNESLHNYISDRVQSIPYLAKSNTGDEVITSVFEAAQGVWLNARLALDEIQRLRTGSLATRSLGLIPADLNNLYSHVLRSFEDSLSVSEILLAQQLYLWLDLDDYLPKYLVMGYEFFQHGTLQLCFQFASRGQTVSDPLGLASRLCGPLLEISNISPGQAQSSSLAYEVRYTHYSAKSYIKYCSSQRPEVLPKIMKARRLRHLRRAEVAVWYYTECPKSAADVKRLRSRQLSHSWPDSYMEMTYNLWAAFQLTELPSDLDEVEIAEAARILTSLSRFLESGHLVWVESAMRINYSGKWPHLLHNAVCAWSKVQLFTGESLPTALIPAFTDFQSKRLQFLEEYIVALQRTGPKCPSVRKFIDNPVVRVGKGRVAVRGMQPAECQICFTSLPAGSAISASQSTAGMDRLLKLGALINSELEMSASPVEHDILAEKEFDLGGGWTFLQWGKKR